MFYLYLFSALDRHQVDYLLIGGLAVSLSSCAAGRPVDLSDIEHLQRIKQS